MGLQALRAGRTRTRIAGRRTLHAPIRPSEVALVDEERVIQSRSEVAPVNQSVAYEPATRESVVEESVRRSPSGGEVARRVVVFVFGIVQGLIGLRIVLLLVDASQANGIVRFVYDVSAVLIGPFEGVLHTNAVQAGASVLDIAALVAIVGWTILEALIIGVIGILRREA